MTKRTLMLATLMLIVGLLLFYQSDNPFRFAFMAGLGCILGGVMVFGITISLLLIRSQRWRFRIPGAILLMVSATVILLGISALYDYRIFLQSHTSGADWEQDMDFLARRIVEVHPNPFNHTTRENFAATIAAEKTAIPRQSNAQITMQLVKLVALLHDGHSTFPPVQPATGFHMYPLQLYVFSDGVYVTDASPKYASLVGQRLVRIGAVGTDEAYARLSPFVGADNEITVKDRIQQYFLSPEVLLSQGIIPDIQSGVFTFADERGSETQVRLEPVSVLRYFYWLLQPLAEWKYRADSSKMPLCLQRPWDNYWFTYDPQTRVLIFEFHQVRNKREETFAQFAKRLLQFAGSHPVDRFIIDIRENTGGDNTLVTGFVEDLGQQASLNQKGKLFTLIGRHTFSAAVNFTSLLENKTETIFVGESTGAGPNHYGDALHIILPRSKAFVLISSLPHEFGDPDDSRTSHDPDIPVEMSHRDYFSLGDPALEAALAFHATPPRDEVKLGSAEASRYAGRYSFEPDKVLQIRNINGRLELEVTDLIRTSIYPISPVRFHTGRSIWEITFQTHKDPLQDEVLWSVNGRTRILQRLPANFKTPSELLLEGELPECMDAYRKLKRDHPSYAPLAEPTMNSRGYEFLNERKFGQAITLFQLNAEFHPGSANAFDSLAEAYMLAGDKQKAIANYRRSLELNSNNSNARKTLKKLE